LSFNIWQPPGLLTPLRSCTFAPQDELFLLI
jgi:hypothetical protein